MSLKDKLPNLQIPIGTNKIKVYAFVGPSGTGKSYRAQMVASEKNINFINSHATIFLLLLFSFDFTLC